MLSMLSFLLSNKKQKISLSNTFNQGISGGPSGKESTCQCRICRKCRLHSWVGKIPWRKKWQGSPVFLTIKSHGQRSLVGYSPWGGKEADMTKWLSIQKASIQRWQALELLLPTAEPLDSWILSKYFAYEVYRSQCTFYNIFLSTAKEVSPVFPSSWIC